MEIRVDFYPFLSSVYIDIQVYNCS